jgi:nitronate monooxygenase
VENRFARELAGREDLPPYPVLNALTSPLRRAAAEAGRAEFLSLWAGQALGLARELPAAELVARLAEETRAALDPPG